MEIIIILTGATPNNELFVNIKDDLNYCLRTLEDMQREILQNNEPFHNMQGKPSICQKKRKTVRYSIA